MITIELGPRCSEVLLQREDAKEVFFVCVVMSFNDRVIRFLTMLFISKKQTEFFYDLTKVYFTYSYFDYWIHMSYNTDISYHRLRNHYPLPRSHLRYSPYTKAFFFFFKQKTAYEIRE